MYNASAVRLQIESALAQKIPSALTPISRMIRPVVPTGIESLDEVLKGGVPVGAITELVGPECSGRTAVALSLLSRTTQAAKVCAWIDVSDTLDPTSAAAAGVDLSRLLWVRCGVMRKTMEPPSNTFTLPEKYLVPPAIKKGLHGGGFGPHPRTEANGLPDALHSLLRPEACEPHPGDLQRGVRPRATAMELNLRSSSTNLVALSPQTNVWARMEQALRATDLLLQAGGFSAIVLDLGSLTPEAVSRAPLATWYRYRAAAERTQSSILLLTQHPCARGSSELLLRFQPGRALCSERTVFTGIASEVEVARRRFQDVSSNVIPLRKPPQRVNVATWQSRTVWAGRR